MLNVTVNSEGHFGTLPPFYETFSKMRSSSNKCLKYTHPMYGWFDLNHFSMQYVYPLLVSFSSKLTSLVSRDVQVLIEILCVAVLYYFFLSTERNLNPDMLWREDDYLNKSM